MSQSPLSLDGREGSYGVPMYTSGSRMPTSTADVDEEEEGLYVEDEDEYNEVEEEYDEEAAAEPADLTEEVAATALSKLGHNPDGELIYTTMSLSSLGLTGIDLLGIQFNHIQTLTLDRNNITSLAPLASFTSLTVLSVAHNQLDAAGVFAALAGSPKNGARPVRPFMYLPSSSTAYSPLKTLKKLVLHHNEIETMEGLKQFSSCNYVDLSHNAIRGTIADETMNNMPALRYLDISHNAIDEVDAWAFENTGLWELDISHNNLSACAFVALLQPTLVKLNLAGNSLMHFDSVAGLTRLTTVDLSNNNVYELAEVLHLQECPSLRFVHLVGNPAFVDAIVGGGTKSAAAAIQQLVSTGAYKAKGEDDDDLDDGVAVDPAEVQQAQRRAAGGNGDSQQRRQMRSSMSKKAGDKSTAAVLSPLETLRRKQRQELRSTAASQNNATLLKSHGSVGVSGQTQQQLGTSSGDGAAAADLNVNASPDEEDLAELNSMSPARQTRLRVLWRLPAILELDGVKVTPGELALAQCLEGGADRNERQSAKERAFGAGASFSGGGPTSGNTSLSTSSRGGAAVGGGRAVVAQLRNVQR